MESATQQQISSGESHQAAPTQRDWQTFRQTYGNQNRVLLELLQNHETQELKVDTVEIRHEEKVEFLRQEFTDLRSFEMFLNRKPAAGAATLRALTVRSLPKDLIKLLGAYFHMEDDLWTSRVADCDREYFAAPLNQKGATKFFHFHLACVDFYCTTNETPQEWRRSRKINHTTRLFTLMDSGSTSRRAVDEQKKVMVIRCVAGHLRLDGNRWTFLYHCDPIEGLDQAHYVRNLEIDSLQSSSDWVSDCLAPGVSDVYAADLCKDGFGIMAKILRDIKSSWKLLLTQCETFLEEVNENFNDQDFIDAAGFLNREFLLNVDYFQRQLFYNERCVTYLSSPPVRGETNILPTIFTQDFVQESHALKVVGLRLNALRLRTTTALDMIMSLNSIKQTGIQQQDSKNALAQGESLRKLTLVNMAFLPPSFAAAVFGMNTKQTTNLNIWVFIVTCLILCALARSLHMLRVFNGPHHDTDMVTHTGPNRRWPGDLFHRQSYASDREKGTASEE